MAVKLLVLKWASSKTSSAEPDLHYLRFDILWRQKSYCYFTCLLRREVTLFNGGAHRQLSATVKQPVDT